MLEVFEVEKKICDNGFIIKFKEIQKHFLVQLLPFRIWDIRRYDADYDYSKYIEDPQGSLCYHTPLFIVTNKCNLNCDYCYADAGSYGIKSNMMDDKTIVDTFNLLYHEYSSYLSNPNNKEIEINAICFGGEPFLNIEAMASILNQEKIIANKLKKEFPTAVIRFKQHINTNAYAFTSKVKDYLINNKEAIEVVCSYDGLFHDLHRLGNKGEFTGDIVKDNILFLIDSGIQTTITCCIHPSDISSIGSNIEYLLDTFKDKVDINFSFLRGSLHIRKAGGLHKEYLYSDSDLLNAASIISEHISRGHRLYTGKFGNIQSRASLYRCPAIGKNEMCIMTNGYVYPCHNFVDKKYTYGHISNLIIKNDEFEEMCTKRTIFNTIGCENCCMKSICLSSFDCPSHSLFDLNNFYKNDESICNFARKVQYQLFLRYVKSLLNENQ